MNAMASICRELLENGFASQRKLSEATGFSLGKVNKLMSQARAEGLIERGENGYRLTRRGMDAMKRFRVDNAVILAAGFGSRFVPITFEIPKGLIEVRGQPMIERQIEQLLDRGISDITVVTGYMKEKFDYLIDKYGVKLAFNPEYATKNNLASLMCAVEILKNTYVLSADNWIENNIFHKYETESWYSCVYMEGRTSEWCVGVWRDGRIRDVAIGGYDSWVMYGPVFFSSDFSNAFAPYLRSYYNRPGTENYLWENVLIENLEHLPVPMYINKQSSENVYEFETLQELRKFDQSYETNSRNDAISTASEVLGVQESDICGIRCVKQGMTNRSFAFSVGSNDYIFRIPGAGTEKLIDRKREKISYDAIAPLGISDEVIYFDENTGIKISKYFNGARNADASNAMDVADCMGVLRTLHGSGVLAPHSFDVTSEIERYLSLCENRQAIRFNDYMATYKKMTILSALHASMNAQTVLCHVDCNPDNIMRLTDGHLRIIDWEYAGMSDPLIDVAMFAIYSYYSKQQLDRLLEIYLGRRAEESEIIRAYIFASLGGYLWALWSEYKQSFGVEFGEYGLKMYRYAKDFYKHVQSMRGSFI
jgi:CTP:phosphocholine cytidylyltransferase-like protein/thiamine kinase-like enzyme/biotin operon repressor